MRRITELEPERSRLGERAVVDRKRSTRLRQRLKRAPALIGLRIVQHQVALTERAALNVLPGQANRDALLQE